MTGRARSSSASLPMPSDERDVPTGALGRRRVRGALATVALGLIGAGVQSALPTASAQDDVEFARRPYVGVGAGITRLEPDSPSDSLSVEDETSAGFHVLAGYDLTRWLSAELYFADLGEAGIDFLGTGVGDIGYSVYGINAVAYLVNSRGDVGPLAGADSSLATRRGLSLFLTTGLGGMSNDSDLDYRRDHDLHVTFGAGLEYGFDNGVALRAELQSYDVDAQYASLSVLKRFGGPRARTAAPERRVAERPDVVPEVAEATPAPAAPAAALPVDAPPARPYDGPTMFRPIVPPYLYFPFDSATLTPDSVRELDAFVELVRDTDFGFDLGGHTDSVGPEGYNFVLSERRARAVREHLLGRGIEPARLDVDAWGETRPISTNATERGRGENRRAEITLVR